MHFVAIAIVQSITTVNSMMLIILMYEPSLYDFIVESIFTNNYDNNELYNNLHMCSHWVLTLSLPNRCKFTTKLY